MACRTNLTNSRISLTISLPKLTSHSAARTQINWTAARFYRHRLPSQEVSTHGLCLVLDSPSFSLRINQIIPCPASHSQLINLITLVPRAGSSPLFHLKIQTNLEGAPSWVSLPLARRRQPRIFKRLNQDILCHKAPCNLVLINHSVSRPMVYRQNLVLWPQVLCFRIQSQYRRLLRQLTLKLQVP